MATNERNLQAAGKRRPGRRSLTLAREGRTGYLFIAPATLLLTLFYLYPLAQNIGYSFTNWNPAGTGDTEFVGIQNYADILSPGSDFLNALTNSAVIALTVVPVSIVLGLVLATLLDGNFRGRTAYRTMIFAPFIAPTVGSALVYSYLLTPLGGLINQGISVIGLGQIAFLTDESWALPAVIVFIIWRQTGYCMIISSAALSTIPVAYHEAAKLDGASATRRFITITVPLVVPTIGFLAVTGTLSALQIFTEVFVLTRGGPLGSSETILFWIYEQGFEFFNGGLATAASVVLLGIGIFLILVQLGVLSKRDNPEMI